MRSLTPDLTPFLVHKSRAFWSALERIVTKLSVITLCFLCHLERFGNLKIGGGGGQGVRITIYRMRSDLPLKPLFFSLRMAELMM